jgi:hypothetical protein
MKGVSDEVRKFGIRTGRIGWLLRASEEVCNESYRIVQPCFRERKRGPLWH